MNTQNIHRQDQTSPLFGLNW